MKSLVEFLLTKIKLFSFFAVLTTLLHSSSLIAQNTNVYKQKKNEIYFGYGTITIPELSFFVYDYIITVLDVPAHRFEYTGAINAGYLYHPNKRVAIGLSGTFEGMNVKYASPARSEKWVTFTIMVNGRFYYISKPAIQLYSGIGGGYMRLQKTQPDHASDDAVAFHANLLGLRVGKNVGGFVELGFGYQGILNGGVSLRF